jgi:hypothetical protein
MNLLIHLLIHLLMILLMILLMVLLMILPNSERAAAVSRDQVRYTRALLFYSPAGPGGPARPTPVGLYPTHLKA